MAVLFKAMSVLCLIMFASVLVEKVDARFIHYGAIGRDKNPGCSAKNQENCNHGEANHYDRGCNTETDCRTGPPKPNE